MAMDIRSGLDLSKHLVETELSKEDSDCILCDYTPPLITRSGRGGGGGIAGPLGGGIAVGPEAGGVLSGEFPRGGEPTSGGSGGGGVGVDDTSLAVRTLNSYLYDGLAAEVDERRLARDGHAYYELYIRANIPAHPTGRYPAKPEWRLRSVLDHLFGLHQALPEHAQLGIMKRMLRQRLISLRANGLEVLDGRTQRRKTDNRAWKEYMDTSKALLILQDFTMKRSRMAVGGAAKTQL